MNLCYQQIADKTRREKGKFMFHTKSTWKWKTELKAKMVIIWPSVTEQIGGREEMHLAEKTTRKCNISRWLQYDLFYWQGILKPKTILGRSLKKHKIYHFHFFDMVGGPNKGAKTYAYRRPFYKTTNYNRTVHVFK